MFKNLYTWILTNVFHVQTQTTSREIEVNQKYARDYENIQAINFNAIFSNKLANYVISDSELTIDGDNARTELLNKTGQSMWKKMKKITSMGFGFGGVVLVPYVANGKIYYNIVPQSRMTIDETDGDLITGATILAEKKKVGNGPNEKTYLRWTNYQIKNGTLTITQQYSDDKGVKLPAPMFWENIQEVMSISNVDRVPFGFIKSPINNRISDDKYGVPITFGCDDTINEIRECLEQIAKEFSLKEVMITIDKTALKDGKLAKSGIYTPVNLNGNEDFYNVFDPAIRDSSFYARLQELYQRLEHEIGTSAGILSDVKTKNATATEIKRSLYDTFSIVDDMRTNIEKGLEDFFYACNVLANAYKLSPMGEYELSYDWSYMLVEDTEAEYNQLVQGFNLGVISKLELRKWIKPTESEEDAAKALAEIEETNPTIKDLFGTNEEDTTNND